MKNSFALMLIWLWLGATASAQAIDDSPAAPRAKADKSSGVISGRLTDTTGQPIANAVIYIRSSGYHQNDSRNTSTDEQGHFRSAGLTASVYYVSLSVPGYLRDDEETQPKTYRAGDVINITMTKGGVITGTLMNQANEPMTGVTVQTIRIRDKDGHPLSTSRVGYNAEADDRGVYRLYGLPSGTYLVFAPGQLSYLNLTDAYQKDVPTFYPSSTRGTAQPVTVRVGEEANDIDIRYRGERGHAISGKIMGLPPDSASRNVNVQLFNVTTHTFEAMTFLRPPGFQNSFAFYGLTDNEYLLTAFLGAYDDKAGGIGRARVKIKGADVTGLEITLAPDGAIAGTLVIAPPPAGENPVKCESKRRLAPDELLIRTRREEKPGEAGVNDDLFRQITPSGQGEFALIGLEAGQYRVAPAMLGEDYFVRSITLPAPAPNQPPQDASRLPLNLRAGERINNLTLNVAGGAAAVRGRVTPIKEGAALPDRLRIHLVPAEKEAAGDVLRFAEVSTNADGAFAITNLAPGHYFILARAVDEDKASDAPVRPVAWNTTERAALREQAEAANVTLDLQPCQRLADVVIKYTPSAAKPVRKPRQ